jgi:superfamily I DNA/RNA helicase
MNFNLRCVDFSRTQQIFLEKNYRSTGSILAACLALVSQGRLSVIVVLNEQENEV